MTPEEFIYKKQLISPHSFIFSSYGDRDYTLVELLTEYAKLIEQNSHKHGVVRPASASGSGEPLPAEGQARQTSARTCATGCDWPNCTLEGCVDPKCDC